MRDTNREAVGSFQLHSIRPRSLGPPSSDGGHGPPGATHLDEDAGSLPPELPGGRPLRDAPRVIPNERPGSFGY
jgi:hypothetical protein